MTSVVSRTATPVNHHPISTMTVGDNYYCHDHNNNNQKSTTMTTVLPDKRTNGSRTNNNNSSSNIDTNGKNNNDHEFVNNTGKPYKNTHGLKMFFGKHHSSSRSRTETNMEKPNIIQPTTPATVTPSRKAADNNNIRFLYNQHAATLSEETIKNQHDEKIIANNNIKTNDNNSHGQRQQIEVNDYLYTLLFFSHLNIYLLLFIATYTLFFEKCFFL